ncbi:histidine phosphatase family protein [Enterovirga aerilata]|uniref:Histidine phosphatase family protein n=1 Tax=Enterovirga aerilata TaxID=2730920 RepID=A0A849I394_9HYPH|nr:histidine phosphatase family protein [Enterovirga sp. DB1703]
MRHAAHERVDRILCGRMPGVSLGERGRAQAARVAERLSRESLAAIYSSPLERARETAAPISSETGLPVGIAPGLDEIDMGEWTGRSFDELQADPRWRSWNIGRAAGEAPGGERMEAVQRRVLAELEAIRLRHPGRTAAAVSHCDVIKAAVCGVLGLSLDRYHSFEIEPASITSLVLWEGGGKVVALNERCGA